MDCQPVLEGPLLKVRPLVETDYDALYAVASDPLLWVQHPAHDRWQAPVFRDFFAATMATGGAAAVIERASGAIIGSSRWDRYRPDLATVEIGGTFLARSHWGGPGNRELKRLMMAHAFRFVKVIEFHIGEGNRRSRIAIERIGGRLTDRTEVVSLAGRDAVHVIYEVTGESFANGPLSAGGAGNFSRNKTEAPAEGETQAP